MRHLFAAVLLGGSLFVGGCDRPQTIVGTKPADRLNAAMPAAQKAAVTKRKQEMGDLPTP